MSQATSENPDVRTRQSVLNLLKQHGPSDSNALAARLGVSAMAVRQHLYALHAKKLVDFNEQPRPLGRPAKLWHLTEHAQKFFPEAYADLALGLLSTVQETFGAEGFSQLLEARTHKQVFQYRAQIDESAPLRRRLEQLAAVRSAEGYMAGVEDGADGGFLFTENHCPICAVAKACSGLCSNELQVFREVMGGGIRIERTEHILSGARRCTYAVREVAPAESIR